MTGISFLALGDFAATGKPQMRMSVIALLGFGTLALGLVLGISPNRATTANEASLIPDPVGESAAPELPSITTIISMSAPE